jgi:hypothetical protein
MTTQEIATRLADLCRKGEFQTVYQELYSPDCISIEPKGAMVEVCNGLEEMAAKGQAWNESMIEFHGSTVGEPIVADNHFCLTMMIDATLKETGREKMNELCVYEVKDGKIVKEQFFYEV